jgi:hypothetical protein
MGTLGTHNTGDSTSSMVFSILVGAWDGKDGVKGGPILGGKRRESEAGRDEENEGEIQGANQEEHSTQKKGKGELKGNVHRQGGSAAAGADEVLQDSVSRTKAIADTFYTLFNCFLLFTNFRRRTLHEHITDSITCDITYLEYRLPS